MSCMCGEDIKITQIKTKTNDFIRRLTKECGCWKKYDSAELKWIVFFCFCFRSIFVGSLCLLFSFMKTRKIHQRNLANKERTQSHRKMDVKLCHLDDGNDNNKTAAAVVFIAHRNHSVHSSSQFCRLNKNKWLLHCFDGFYVLPNANRDIQDAKTNETSTDLFSFPDERHTKNEQPMINGTEERRQERMIKE